MAERFVKHGSFSEFNGRQFWAKVVLVDCGEQRNNLDKRVSVLWVAYQTRVERKLVKSIFDAKITGGILGAVTYVVISV